MPIARAASNEQIEVSSAALYWSTVVESGICSLPYSKSVLEYRAVISSSGLCLQFPRYTSALGGSLSTRVSSLVLPNAHE